MKMKSKLESLLDKQNIPGHIAIIMDGNGRWAKTMGLDRVNGHKEGIKSVKSTVTAARELGIGFVTLYAFSAQNWSRPEGEVSALMDLLKHYLQEEKEKLVEENVRLKAIGKLSELPSGVHQVLLETMEMTKQCTGISLTLALSYGGREEILDAVSELISREDISPGEIDQELFSKYLYTYDLPEPDLLIRTGGEKRLSNFLLWQLAYTEIYFTNTLWPKFRKRHLLRAIFNYQQRERRFGLTSDQIKKREAL